MAQSKREFLNLARAAEDMWRSIAVQSLETLPRQSSAGLLYRKEQLSQSSESEGHSENLRKSRDQLRHNREQLSADPKVSRIPSDSDSTLSEGTARASPTPAQEREELSRDNTDMVQVNVRERDDFFEIFALVPGFGPSEIDVQCCEAGNFTIRGQPSDPNSPYGVRPFSKEITLPGKIDCDRTIALLSYHGQLYIRVTAAFDHTQSSEHSQQ